MKKIKKAKYKVKREGKLKNKIFTMIETTGGHVPRDTTFPVGESQLFSDSEVTDESRN